MINSVRNTVLSVLNKNNYGYISPSDFNLFAKQSQLDLFETYFYQYNYQINKENARQSGTGYADITKGIEELIDTFSVYNPLTLSNTPPTISNVYSLPSPLTTGDDYYLLNKVLIFNELKANGVTTAVGAGLELIDSAATFVTDGVLPGDTIGIVSGGITQYVTVLTVNSETSLTTTASNVTVTPFGVLGVAYYIYSGQQEEAEKVSHSKITMLNNSILTRPTLTFPAYTQDGSVLSAYPNIVNNVGQVAAQYIRYPLDPKWTFITLTSGEPTFDQSQPDYQDFELPLDCESDLVNKILQYAGVSIREIAVAQFGQANEQSDNQEQK
jgi:hypothetical protein